MMVNEFKKNIFEARKITNTHEFIHTLMATENMIRIFVTTNIMELGTVKCSD
jgi:hypothetical protein